MGTGVADLLLHLREVQIVAIRVAEECQSQLDIIDDRTAKDHTEQLEVFHDIFPTKQQLLLAVLDRYLQGIEQMLLAPAWAGVSDPIERIFALLRQYRGFLLGTECSYGCPIGSLALEFHEPDPVVREKLAATFDAWTSAVERCLQDARERLPADIDVRGLAVFVLTTMEGGVMLARTYRNWDAFDAAVRTLEDYFARLVRPLSILTGETR